MLFLFAHFAGAGHRIYDTGKVRVFNKGGASMECSSTVNAVRNGATVAEDLESGKIRVTIKITDFEAAFGVGTWVWDPPARIQPVATFNILDGSAQWARPTYMEGYSVEMVKTTGAARNCKKAKGKTGKKNRSKTGKT